MKAFTMHKNFGARRSTTVFVNVEISGQSIDPSWNAPQLIFRGCIPPPHLKWEKVGKKPKKLSQALKPIKTVTNCRDGHKKWALNENSGRFWTMCKTWRFSRNHVFFLIGKIFFRPLNLCWRNSFCFRCISEFSQLLHSKVQTRCFGLLLWFWLSFEAGNMQKVSPGRYRHSWGMDSFITTLGGKF